MDHCRQTVLLPSHPVHALPMLVLAHRGCHDNAPENSLRAFAAAAARGIVAGNPAAALTRDEHLARGAPGRDGIITDHPEFGVGVC